eukprot:g3257.t1
MNIDDGEDNTEASQKRYRSNASRDAAGTTSESTNVRVHSSPTSVLTSPSSRTLLPSPYSQDDGIGSESSPSTQDYVCSSTSTASSTISPDIHSSSPTDQSINQDAKLGKKSKKKKQNKPKTSPALKMRMAGWSPAAILNTPLGAVSHLVSRQRRSLASPTEQTSPTDFGHVQGGLHTPAMVSEDNTTTTTTTTNNNNNNNEQWTIPPVLHLPILRTRVPAIVIEESNQQRWAESPRLPSPFLPPQGLPETRRRPSPTQGGPAMPETRLGPLSRTNMPSPDISSWLMPASDYSEQYPNTPRPSPQKPLPQPEREDRVDREMAPLIQSVLGMTLTDTKSGEHTTFFSSEPFSYQHDDYLRRLPPTTAANPSERFPGSNLPLQQGYLPSYSQPNRSESRLLLERNLPSYPQAQASPSERSQLSDSNSRVVQGYPLSYPQANPSERLEPDTNPRLLEAYLPSYPQMAANPDSRLLQDYLPQPIPSGRSESSDSNLELQQPISVSLEKAHHITIYLHVCTYCTLHHSMVYRPRSEGSVHLLYTARHHSMVYRPPQSIVTVTRHANMQDVSRLHILRGTSSRLYFIDY